MNKKKIFQIIVIVVAFGGSGVVLYNGFFAGPSTSPVVMSNVPAIGAPGSTGGTAGSATGSVFPGINSTGGVPTGGAPLSGNQDILPVSRTLDFSVLDSKKFSNIQFNYPKLSSQGNVGIPEDSLVIPLPTQ